MERHYDVSRSHRSGRRTTPSEQNEKEDAVEKTKSITMQVLESLQRNPVCEFDQLVADCTNFTWNQIFYEVDRLSRVGQLCLTPAGRGYYSLRLMQKGVPHEAELVRGQSEASTIPISSSVTESEC